MIAVASQTSVYFAVPDHYTIGREFASYDEAVAAAQADVKPIDGCPGSWTRAFVDVRVKDNTGDRMLHRVEVFPEVTA